MGWGACLSGHLHDLEDWQAAFAPPFQPRVERIEREYGPEFVLRCCDLDALASAAEVHAAGGLIVARLNGAMAVARSSKPVHCSGAARFDPTGAVSFHFFVSAHAEARARATVSAAGLAVGPDGAELTPPPPTASEAQLWFAAGRNSPVVARLLTQLGDADDWPKLYKAIELLEELVGGEHKLRAFLLNHGIAIKPVRSAANFHRHANGPKPAVLVDLGDAHAVVLSAARRVLASLKT